MTRSLFIKPGERVENEEVSPRDPQAVDNVRFLFYPLGALERVALPENELNFSVSQWLSSIVLDVLMKFVLVTAVGLVVTYGLISIASLAMTAIFLSLLHFVCLFVGATLVVTPELFGVRLSPMPRFAASVALANMLFVGVVVVLIWPGPNDIPRTAKGPIVAAVVLAATNLVALLAVAVAGALIRRLKPRGRADESVPGA